MRSWGGMHCLWGVVGSKESSISPCHMTAGFLDPVIPAISFADDDPDLVPQTRGRVLDTNGCTNADGGQRISALIVALGCAIRGYGCSFVPIRYGLLPLSREGAMMGGHQRPDRMSEHNLGR